MKLGRPKEKIIGCFLLGLDSRVWKQLENTLGSEIIESLGHEKKFGKRPEISISLRDLVKTNLCNSCVSLFANNSLIVEWKERSPPDLGHCLVELGEQIFSVLFYILYFLYLVCSLVRLWF